MDIIKNEAKLLTEEGNLISKIKGITEENYTMEEYVPKIEDIIETKLSYFKELKQKIKPILEDLTLNVLKKKPDNIVSNILFNFVSLYSWLNI